jgi:hypothetical protein
VSEGQTPEDLLYAALDTQGYVPRLEALRLAGRTLLATGTERDELYEIVSEMAQSLGYAKREEEQDILESLLDEIGGWCPPGSEL